MILAAKRDDMGRLADRVDFGDFSGCWNWTGIIYREGYGQFSLGHRTVQAYRALWELAVGPVPEGLELDHLCRNRACVNPDHLELVTHRENMLRGNTWAAANARKTHCPRGHPYDEENTRINNKGSRECWICRRRKGAATSGGEEAVK